jgi:hypothetical protein
VDALANAWRFGPDDLAALVAAHPGVRGLVQVRRVIDLMDARAESLPESRLRVGLVRRGVPAPVLQYPGPADARPRRAGRPRAADAGPLKVREHGRSMSISLLTARTP